MAASFMASHAVCSDFIVKSCHDDVAGNDSNFFRRLKILTPPAHEPKRPLGRKQQAEAAKQKVKGIKELELRS